MGFSFSDIVRSVKKIIPREFKSAAKAVERTVADVARVVPAAALIVPTPKTLRAGAEGLAIGASIAAPLALARIAGPATVPGVSAATEPLGFTAGAPAVTGGPPMGFDVSSILGTIGTIGGAFGVKELARLAPGGMVANGGGVMPTAGRGGGGFTPTAGPVAVGAVITAATFIAGLLARATAALGRRITKKAVLDMIRKFGPAAAATALTWTAAETVQFWMLAEGLKPRRRARGITGRQLSNARGVIRRITGFNKQLQDACRPAMPRRVSRRVGGHKAGCKCVVCR